MRSAGRSLFVIGLCAVSLAAADTDTDIHRLLDGGHWKQARALLEPRVKANPSDAEAAAQLSSVRAAYGDWDAALAELDGTLAESERDVPDNLSPYYRAASIIIGQGNDYARAERYLRKYLTQEPEPNSAAPAYAHWRLGQVLEKEGRRADALAELEQATKLKPDLDDAKKDLVRVRASR